MNLVALFELYQIFFKGDSLKGAGYFFGNKEASLWGQALSWGRLDNQGQ